jgi:uncharacterized protein with GYD domain
MQKTKTVLAVITGLALIIALSVGAWQLEWFIQEKNVNRKTRIDNQTKGVQSAWQQQVNEGIRDTNIIVEGPQRQAVIRQTCDLAAKLTTTYRTQTIETFTAKEC